MKQVIRKGLKEIIVDDVPDPVVSPHHVLVRPLYSLISSGTETASIHQDSVLREVADNPSHLRKIWEAMKADRVELARKLGAEHGLLGGPAASQQIRSLTNGRGADCVIIAAAAKSAAPCLQAVEICRDRGRIVVVGAVEMSFPWSDMYLKEIQVFMARAYGPGSYDAAYEKQGRDFPVAYVRWTENRNMDEFL